MLLPPPPLFLGGTSVFLKSTPYTSPTPSTHSSYPSPPHAKNKRSKTNGRRAGAPIYNKEEVTALLNCFEKVEPLGYIHWAIVAIKFGQLTEYNERPERNFDSLRHKLDRLFLPKRVIRSNFEMWKKQTDSFIRYQNT